MISIGKKKRQFKFHINVIYVAQLLAAIAHVCLLGFIFAFIYTTQHASKTTD